MVSSTGVDATRDELSGEGRILMALENLTNEVLSVRRMLDPITRRQRVAIIAGSAFLGGVITNLALWAAGAGTMYGLVHH